MPNTTKYEIYVTVHKGDPIDFSKYRHTGLWFVPEDGSSHYYYHVKGLTGEFSFEWRKDFDPTTSRTFAKKVRVGTTHHSLTSSELTSQMESVDVLNNDPEFDCQQWVELALKALYHAGHLTAAQYETGLSGMIDATMDAKDE
ncbi:hypothetical protein BKA56DRAFT_635994 [Ilyonectria sp. MPI-CAGE-AT-0026]|nr:hypothetical protein BKA56DRAFT_635994 [Ilyonectria sp. MPI-CAGE-AT-0026]